MRTMDEINHISAMLNSPDREMQDLGMSLYTAAITSTSLKEYLEDMSRASRLSNAKGGLASQAYLLGKQAARDKQYDEIYIGKGNDDARVE